MDRVVNVCEEPDDLLVESSIRPLTIKEYIGKGLILRKSTRLKK